MMEPFQLPKLADAFLKNDMYDRKLVSQHVFLTFYLWCEKHYLILDKRQP